MENEGIRAATELLVGRVSVTGEGEACQVRFEAIDRQAMLDAGIPAAVIDRIRGAAWWDEMVEDVIDTPDFCDDDATADQVLGYAQDVVREYVRKRY